MKALRKVRNIELNKGDLQANGLFNLSNETDISFWFDVETKTRLMKLNDAEFWHQADSMIKESQII